MKKRGQLTVFMIIGLVLVLTFIALTYSKRGAIEDTELIQPELVPVQSYIETCTDNLAREGLMILGLNGGYITFPPFIEGNPQSYLSRGPVSDFKNPYWRYPGKSAVPTLDFMASQLSEYIEANLDVCIDDFSAFENQYVVIENGDYDVVTEINEEDVLIRTIYPLEVQNRFNKTLAELQRFVNVIPIRLKQVHKMASTIMEQENKDFFVEDIALDLFSMDDTVIPSTGLGIDCGAKRWKVSDIENNISTLFQINFPYIKIAGTDYNTDRSITKYQLEEVNPFNNSDLYSDSYYNHHYIWDVGHEDPNMKVSFSYDSGLDLNIEPSKGDYVESNPQQGSRALSFLCMHMWHFTYDALFPVTVSIVDQDTPKNDRFAFTFAFVGAINNNQPDASRYSEERFLADDSYVEEDYCNDVTNTVSVIARNPVSDRGINSIDGVNVTFICGRFRCEMGTTEVDFDRPSSDAQLRKKFPYCSNGIIRVSKDGYISSETFAGTGRLDGTNPEDELGGTFTLEMTPLKSFNVSVVKHSVTDGVVGPAQELNEEVAFVSIRNEAYEAHAAYDPSSVNESFNLSIMRGAGFTEYTYELDIYVRKNETITASYKTEWTPSNSDMDTTHILFHAVENTEDEEHIFLPLVEELSTFVAEPEFR